VEVISSAYVPTPLNLPDIEPSIDAIFAEWDNPDSPGCTVAVIQDGQIVYKKGFGMANLEYGIPNDPGTIYHVASLSKQFTAFAVQLLASEGKLSLDEDVRLVLPELHDFGSKITIRHLIHHTSGLRDQWNLLGMAGWRSGDVITEEDILNILWRQKELNFEPGTEKLYSNSGYTLMSQIVKRVSGVSFRQFCEEQIFAPLGMIHTHFHDDHTEIVKGRAYSYSQNQDGSFKHFPLQYGNVGATSLFTTVEDLSLWDRNFDRPKVGDVALLQEMHKNGVLNNGVELDYASGLINGSYRGLRTVGHDGADAGFRSTFQRFPDQRFAVIIFANLSSFNPNLLAHKVAEVFLGDLMSPAEESKSDSPNVPTEFGVQRELRQEYVGDYYSPELGVIYTITEEDGTLKLAYPKGIGTLQPTKVDEFECPIGRINFERKPEGVTGFLIDNGRVRRLLFEVWRRQTD
jgi:CubicO group peptidase (beta-lactamase class C family)